MANAQAHLVPERVVERVLTKVEPSPEGCLVSTYAAASSGYAMVGFYEKGKQYNALCHRVAWAVEHGEIPEGMTVHHECFNRKCVNTAHMRMTERWQNARRTGGEDWPEGTCKRGHDDSGMTYYPELGKRRCAPCYEQEKRRKR